MSPRSQSYWRGVGGVDTGKRAIAGARE